MKNVLLIDPSGDAYGAGLADGLSNKVKLFYITRDNDTDKSNISAEKFYWFIGGNKIKKGLQYILAYCRILRLIRKKKIDIVHIEWLLVPQFDKVMLRIMRWSKAKLILTAHNVLPHRNSEEFIGVYRRIYGYFDKIIVHGEGIKREFVSYFPEYESKIQIERHGVYLGQSLVTSSDSVDSNLIQRIDNYTKVAIFFGNIFYNKGIDRLIRHWLESYQNREDFFLIIVGKKHPKYDELTVLEEEISTCANIYYKPEEVTEIELNTLISFSDIIVMPYRHASMSGIVFKAAETKRAIVTTDVGSITEYVDESCAYITQNDDSAFCKQFDYIMDSISKERLKKVGEQLYVHIHNNYAWDQIATKTILEVYE